jgi:hypothetical protein
MLVERSVQLMPMKSSLSASLAHKLISPTVIGLHHPPLDDCRGKPKILSGGCGAGDEYLQDGMISRRPLMQCTAG